MPVLAAQGLSAGLHVAHAGRLPFADASFDHVRMMWTLEHLTENSGTGRAASGRPTLPVVPVTRTVVEGEFR
ncbi:methyltransferase domain-containing protein [Streptomyces sp. NPDC056716]|uniref:methyltransferase domain-containing protein n=1 Tax=unclassified Streptomyces TaxID=2593676 RepID=UPI0036BD8C19